MAEISVIIVNFNGGDHPKAALQSLAAQNFRDFEVIFIDNASSDGSADNLPTDGCPKVSVIRSKRNMGFAEGNNHGAKLASGKWIALLNPDAVAAPDWLESLIEARSRYKDVKMFASAQYASGNPDVMDGAGDAYLVFGMPWRGGFGRAITEMPKEECLCFSPCGAGAFFETQTFLEHGGFDERFFCFCEDVDIGFRLQLVGHDCVFLPQAIIHHYGGHSSEKVSEFSTYHGGRNRVWTYVKNMPLFLLLITMPAHILLSLYLLMRAFMTGNGKATAKAMWAGAQGLPSLLSDQRWRVRDRKISLWSLSRKMAWNPWTMSGRHVHVRPMKGNVR